MPIRGDRHHASTDQGSQYLFVPTMSQDASSPIATTPAREYFDLNNLFGRVVTSNQTMLVQDGMQHGVQQIWPEGVPPPAQFFGHPHPV